MKLSERLTRVAANVTYHGVVADVGCDHGFTSIHLIQTKQAVRAIAMDVNKGPLERAKEHILSHGLEEQITVSLSDGLEKLEPNQADTILISGMGGLLICRILTQHSTVTKSAKELVLSPQSDVAAVRRCIHELGFLISHEEMVYDQGKYYVIIRAVPGEEQYLSEQEYIYGKQLIDSKDAVFIRFMEEENRRIEKVLKHMEKGRLSLQGTEQKKKLIKEQKEVCHILGRLQNG